MSRAQSSIEYIILVIIVAAALITMQVYIKRGIQGRWRRGIDELGMQYEPARTNIESLYTFLSNTSSTLRLDRSISSCENATDANPCYSTRRDITNIEESTSESINVEGF